MKVFVSHSKKDDNLYVALAKKLNAQGHIVKNSVSIEIGERWIDKLKEELNESDCLIAIITGNYLDSSWNSMELGYAVFSTKIHVMPVVLNDAFLPTVLMGYQYIKIDSTKDIVSVVLNEINRIKFSKQQYTISKEEFAEQTERNDIGKKIALLHDALINNQLSLVCGAGVSRDSQIPLWNELICNIITDIYFNDAKTNNLEFVERLLKATPNSNLILGKYLKLMLKDDFENMLRKHLYRNVMKDKTHQYAKTNIMKAISNLARPNRTGWRLESIITFNFDDVIENALSINNIKYCSIWKEEQEYDANALPIYHVHGFLPQNSRRDNPNLVFSEESYHSQFIDPYSWSNLAQLTTYSSNVCLFVGLSLSDPNLRRLLDISCRRNPKCKHYIIECKPKNNDDVSEVTTMLFEQDANSLGLNVIWCSDYSDIPEILKRIVE